MAACSEHTFGPYEFSYVSELQLGVCQRVGSVTRAPSLALFSHMLFFGCPPFRLDSSGLCGDCYADRCWIILDVQLSAKVAG